MDRGRSAQPVADRGAPAGCACYWSAIFIDRTWAPARFAGPPSLSAGRTPDTKYTSFAPGRHLLRAKKHWTGSKFTESAEQSSSACGACLANRSSAREDHHNLLL